jgi:hypothetical protein
MKIKLISEEQYNRLLTIQKEFPKLTFQNKGYDEIKESDLSEQDKVAREAVSSVLKEGIVGFSNFQNFKYDKNGEIKIRFQYNYGYDGGIHFIGVGYILLDELLNGFKD